MKSIIALSLMSLLIVGCAKEGDQAESTCDNAACSRYFQTWQNLIKERNGLSDYYYKRHFLPGTYNIQETSNGELFSINYRVRIDWATIQMHDQFMVKINSSSYPGLHARRDVYLSEREIDAILSYRSFDSEMNEVEGVEKLGFASATEAIEVLRAKAKTNEIFFKDMGYKSSTAGFRANGHPYLFCQGIVNPTSRTRLMGEIDLVSRDISTYAQTVQDKSGEILAP